MSEHSKIEWTHATFNPWRGCTKVSPGCAHCYAETLSARNPKVLGTWGRNGTRAIASESYWWQPRAWDRAAGKAGERRRVFCASLADVFEDREDLVAPRERLFAIIDSTPWLDWLLLTKRPENVKRLADLPLPQHVWLGVSVEDQQRAEERIPVLLDTPAAVRFISAEPLLGPLDLELWLGRAVVLPGIDWVIVGGESGPGARSCDMAWVRSIVTQCKAAGVACFVKQLGAKPTAETRHGHGPGVSSDKFNVRWQLKDRKGGDPAEWPEDLRVRGFPR